MCQNRSGKPNKNRLCWSENIQRKLLIRWSDIKIVNWPGLGWENPLVMGRFHCSWSILSKKWLTLESKHTDESCCCIREIICGNQGCQFESEGDRVSRTYRSYWAPRCLNHSQNIESLDESFGWCTSTWSISMIVKSVICIFIRKCRIQT
jgi:hypothetical protein